MKHSYGERTLSYEPPAGNEVFSLSGKAAILGFKFEQIANNVRAGMLQDDTLERFMEGDYDHVLDYDSASFKPFIIFDNPDDERDAVGSIAKKGFEQALRASKIASKGLFGVARLTSEEDPRRARLIMRYFKKSDES